MNKVGTFSAKEIMDLLTKRPDLSVGDVERLLRQQQAPTKQVEPLTKTQKRLLRCGVILLCTTGIALFGYWLSGAPLERGGAALVTMSMWLGISLGCCATACDYE